MTEVPKGLMTSKELGMAVADRLVQAEKRREVRGTETAPKQQTPMRRALQPPASREQRADSGAAEKINRDTRITDKPRSFQEWWDNYKPGDWKDPEKSLWKNRVIVDESRAKMHGLPPFTDEQWKEFERIGTMPLAELLQKYGNFLFPDSPDRKAPPEQRTFWEVIGEMIGGLFEGAAQSHKDRPADKK